MLVFVILTDWTKMNCESLVSPLVQPCVELTDSRFFAGNYRCWLETLNQEPVIQKPRRGRRKNWRRSWKRKLRRRRKSKKLVLVSRFSTVVFPPILPSLSSLLSPLWLSFCVIPICLLTTKTRAIESTLRMNRESRTGKNTVPPRKLFFFPK